MAGWQTLDLSNDCFRVSVTPQSWWRWWWLRHVAYFVGHKPRFDAHIQVLKGPENQDLWWSLHHEDNMAEHCQLAGRAVSGLPDPVTVIQLPMLATSGEYVLKMGQSGSVGDPVAYSFNVVTWEGFIVKLLAPLAFGFFSIGLGIVNACNAD